MSRSSIKTRTRVLDCAGEKFYSSSKWAKNLLSALPNTSTFWRKKKKSQSDDVCTEKGPKIEMSWLQGPHGSNIRHKMHTWNAGYVLEWTPVLCIWMPEICQLEIKLWIRSWKNAVWSSFLASTCFCKSLLLYIYESQIYRNILS